MREGVNLSIYYQDETTKVIHGDCIESMAEMEPDSVSAIVTDPPYGLGFMGKAWDDLPPGQEWAEACLRVLKPGGHLVAFGGTRTWHRLAVSVEDAGFEMRDSLAWLYGAGFPKSQDAGKSTGDERFDGWGTGLKPAFEPIVLARKPFKGTVGNNMIKHGAGAINIDAARNGSGRWPSNVALDEYAAGELDNQGGNRKSGGSMHDSSAAHRGVYNNPGKQIIIDRKTRREPDAGGASRFFYVSKAPQRERPEVGGVRHPTVKPIAIMEWLIGMVTPPCGVLLDPFAGSGTTLEAARKLGFTSIGIEAEETYLPLIGHRLQRSNRVSSGQGNLF